MHIKKLLTFEADGYRRWGVLSADEQGVYSADALEEAYFTPLTETLSEFIRQGNDSLSALAYALEQNEKTQAVSPIPLNRIRIVSPLPENERNIFCIGKNYPDHIAEFERTAKADIPAHPVIFTKAAAAVIGTEDTIQAHASLTKELDYEGELAVIIGKTGADIPLAEAMDYVYGFTILNDVTARDLQRRHSQWFHGKSLDTFCPMGPYILLRDAAPDHFTIRTEVNGEIRQDASTSECIFSIPQLLHILSQGTTVHAGDVLATGTPAGVGIGFQPPKFLKAGDTVRITISSIGTLTNTVR